MPLNPSESPPILSVVIPCFKQAKYLATAIDSALNQATDHGSSAVQVIVVDDGSPDNPAGVVREFGRRIQFIAQPNSGVGAARNLGLSAAAGQYIHFLDADDVLLPGMLTEHLKVMQATGADVTCSGYNRIDAEGKILRTESAPLFVPDPFHALLPMNLCPPVCYLFKRSVVNAVGGFDPDRRKSGHEDWDLFLRIAARGVRFEPVAAVVAGYRVHGEASASSRYASMYDSGRAVLKKIEKSHGHCPACGDRFHRAFARFDNEYMDYLIRPALVDGPFKSKYHLVWKHFFRRSIGRPALAGAMLSRLIAGAFRRVKTSSVAIDGHTTNANR